MRNNATSHLHSVGACPSHSSFIVRSSSPHMRGNQCDNIPHIKKLVPPKDLDSIVNFGNYSLKVFTLFNDKYVFACAFVLSLYKLLKANLSFLEIYGN